MMSAFKILIRKAGEEGQEVEVLSETTVEDIKRNKPSRAVCFI